MGELRFIARLNKATVPNGFLVSEVNGGTAVEGSDVFLVDGQTRSKFYSSVCLIFQQSLFECSSYTEKVRFIEDHVHGVGGPGVGVFMIIPGVGYETSSGGPFFRGMPVFLL